MSGGSGSNVQRWEPLEELRPLLVPLANAGLELGGQPYVQYQGQQVANLNPIQLQSLGDMINFSATSTPDANAARALTLGILQGNYANPWTDVQTAPGSNPYLAENMYLDAMIGKTTGDIADAYKNATAPSTMAQFHKAGAFGGSAMAEQQARQEKTLADSIGAASNQLRFQDFNQRSGLAEQALQRGLTAQMSDIARGNQNWNQQMAMAASMIPQANQNMQMDAWRIQQMGQAGDYLNNYEQQLLNQARAAWDEAQNWPYKQFDVMTNAVMRALGGYGTNVSQSQQNNSPWGPAVGAGLIGAGLLGGKGG